MSHTPGPWSTAQYDDGDHAIIGPNGDERICEMITNEPDPIREDNARLIAAAPELLEALKKFFTDWPAVETAVNGVLSTQAARGYPYTGPNISEALSQMQAAIDKAEGRS